MQSIRPYGAFVYVGGITGLLHISQVQPKPNQPSSRVIAAALPEQHTVHMCASQQVQSLFLPTSQVSHEEVESMDQILKEGDKLKVLVLSFDRERRLVTLSTKHLEKTPGDMLRSPQLVYESAEEMAAIFKCAGHEPL